MTIFTRVFMRCNDCQAEAPYSGEIGMPGWLQSMAVRGVGIFDYCPECRKNHE